MAILYSSGPLTRNLVKKPSAKIVPTKASRPKSSKSPKFSASQLAASYSRPSRTQQPSVRNLRSSSFDARQSVYNAIVNLDPSISGLSRRVGTFKLPKVGRQFSTRLLSQPFQRSSYSTADRAFNFKSFSFNFGRRVSYRSSL